MNFNLFKSVPFEGSYLDKLHEIENACYPDPWSKAMLSDEIGEEYSEIFLYNNDPIGYISGRLYIDEAHILSIAIEPSWQRKGIGRKFLTDWLHKVREDGAERVHLEVRVSNRSAQNLYISLGFELTGKRVNFYDDPPEDALLMTLDFRKNAY